MPYFLNFAHSPTARVCITYVALCQYPLECIAQQEDRWLSCGKCGNDATPHLHDNLFMGTVRNPKPAVWFLYK
jgi:hypothetical protein